MSMSFHPSHQMGPTPRPRRYPGLEIDQVLAWADAHHARTGEWPTADSGFITEAPRDKWANVDAALRVGLRGLPAGSSLARLLQHHRGVRNRKDLPPFTEAQILAWADAYCARTGAWPTDESGPIQESPEDTWTAVAVALVKGLRGLPGGSSLPQLLAWHRGARNKGDLPALDEERVLAWADAHHARTGKWPTSDTGAIADAPGETWCAVSQALKKGSRGLPGGSSLARFLEEYRGVPNRLNRPDLSVEQILAWADAHRARTGRWPTRTSGAIPEAPSEKWSAVDTCLQQGNRGLPANLSLARLLAEHRGARRQGKPVRVLTEPQILTWADAHHARVGRWPSRDSGSIAEAPGETWMGVHMALAHGHRGLPGGSSLAQLLAERRSVPERQNRPLTEAQILAWADAHYRRTGRWPTSDSGPISGAPGDTWRAIDKALRNGYRDLPGHSSLARLLTAERGVPNLHDRTPLSLEQILVWADAHHARTGQWPRKDSGSIEGSAGQTWSMVNACLTRGDRGLAGGSSLLRLLREHRGARGRARRPDLTTEIIIEWADAHYARHGRWPQVRSGPVEEAPGETWLGIEASLRAGCRGLPGGSSLCRLLAEHRSVRSRANLPDLTARQILTWADAHYARHGQWPQVRSGPIDDAPGETWAGIDSALRVGTRGLPGDSSLHRLISKHRKS